MRRHEIEEQAILFPTSLISSSPNEVLIMADCLHFLPYGLNDVSYIGKAQGRAIGSGSMPPGRAIGSGSMPPSRAIGSAGMPGKKKRKVIF